MAPMRATENNAKGTSGQSFVKGQFEALGWGAIPNPEHDLGTDLFIMARDARRFDLGALVGVQVKNWVLPFDEPELHEGVEGWWFADSADHFDYWLSHRVPHLIVFYDKTAKVSHWAHVTVDTVVNTGVQRKIFVPKSQTIDAEHLDELIEIALSIEPGQSWEGSAWTPGGEVPRESQLRYAMLTPRLVAPHGNAEVSEVSAPEAIALLAAVRLHDIGSRYVDRQPLLDPDTSAASDDVDWQLFAAIHQWIHTGTRDAFTKLVSEADSPELRAATLVATVAALSEDGQTREAVELLGAALADWDDYNPVDHAWLTVHHARGLAELGDYERAKRLTLDVAVIGQVAPGDPTARFIAGISAEMLFSLNGWPSAEIDTVIKARDTAASWWRAQAMTSGLSTRLESTFKSWAGDTAIAFGASDQVWDKLRSVMLISAFAGDGSAWRYEASLMAQYLLVSRSNPGEVAAAIDLMRVAGRTKESTLR